jgi:hypothetical protein
MFGDLYGSSIHSVSFHHEATLQRYVKRQNYPYLFSCPQRTEADSDRSENRTEMAGEVLGMVPVRLPAWPRVQLRRSARPPTWLAWALARVPVGHGRGGWVAQVAAPSTAEDQNLRPDFLYRNLASY